MKRLVVLFALVFACSPWLSAQEPSQFLQELKPRCIGPANMSGRITEIAIYEKEPRIQYVASAAGGLWKTVNNGVTWKPVFERESTIALGAVAVCQTNPDLVWVGAGEANPRNSVSWGDGVYKSIDGGKSWQHMGLKETHHIGRVLIHPNDSNVVYVAALGKLWGPNKERGVFKTTDAGKSWQHVLAINDDTGCIDLAMDPGDPELLYAAAYHVRRGVFSGGNPQVQTGPGSGLFKTTDGGRSWQPMTKGLPTRPLGRCGFSIHRKNPNVVFAVVQTDKTPVPTSGQAANEKLNLENGGIFRSDDKGQTWKHVNSLCPRPFYYGQIRVDPNDDQRLYVLGINLHLSKDGGKKFLDGNSAKETHVDYHALWINPRDSHHLILGSDGGVNYSYDKGETWEHLKNLPLAQFYAIGVDMRTPYRVYGGLQDNGTWGGPSTSRDPAGINAAQWFKLLGFDGYYCVVHPRNRDIVYCEGQYGMLHRVKVRTRSSIDIAPRLDGDGETTNLLPPLPKGTPDFRFNWCSPIVQSPYGDDEIFYGGNFLFTTQNRGDSWQIASPDLTRGKPGWNDFRGHSITTIAASTLVDHLLYVGTDDGKIWVCKNWEKKEWTDLSQAIPNLPQSRWITRLEASRFDKGTVYLSIDRHRNDDRKPYLYKSTDLGSTWSSITGNLPTDGPIHVVREDPINKDLLYVGTEFGLYLSLDAGKTWHRQKHLPTVPVHDLVVHPRERELVIGTHGRGIWIMDVLPLQELASRETAEARLFTIRSANAYRQNFKQYLGLQNFFGENAPYGASIAFHIRDKPAQVPTVTILDAQGKKAAEFKGSSSAGLQQLRWNMNHAGSAERVYNPVLAGTYTAVLQIGAKQYKQSFQIEVDD